MARSATPTGTSFRSVIPRTRIKTLPASIRQVPLLAPSRVTFSIESLSRNFFRSLALSQGMSPFQKRGTSRLGVPPEENLTSWPKGTVLHSFTLVAIYRDGVTTQVLSDAASFPTAPRRAAPQALLFLSAPPEH